MRKLIDIPEGAVQDLKILAVKEGKSFKRFIEDKLVELIIKEDDRDNKISSNNDII